MSDSVLPGMTGRIDVHSHLLPGVDDGCETLEESIACARVLVSNGYSHSFVTPHIWPSFPANHPTEIAQRCDVLQNALDQARVPLRLMPGGEMNFRADFLESTPASSLVTYGLQQKFMLIDIWVNVLPEWFEEQVTWLQKQGLKLILAHPERLRAVQDDVSLVARFLDMGMLLQGNLQCLSDPNTSATRQTIDVLLPRGVYTFLGSDLHHLETMPARMKGLRHAIDLVGQDQVNQLTIVNPRMLM